MPLVLSRLHRWTLGQAVTFFDNDFAGRIAQKQMQAARAVTDVATEVINTVAFALASVIGSVLFLLAIDWRWRWRWRCGWWPISADPVLHAARPRQFRGAGQRRGRWCRGRSSTRSPTSRR
jgi:ABC-type multidrug transport system fused ATPase/permease subunit